MSSLLVRRTREALGERADSLLSMGLILPLNPDKTPRTRGSWLDWTDPDKDWGDFWGLAVKTGSSSGITVVDFDTPDQSPQDRNVSTRRGSHVWVPYVEGDRNRQDRTTHVDVRGEHGYACFTSPFHTVIHTDLGAREDYLDHLYPTPEEYSYRCSGAIEDWVLENGGKFGNDSVTAGGYQRALADMGLSVDLGWVSRLLAAQVAGSPQGSRNTTLYVNLAQVIGLGGSPGQVRAVLDAGVRSGLSQAEVRKSLHSARRSPGVVPHLSLAQEWASRAHSRLRSPLTDVLVALAAEQHNQAPLVSKKALARRAGVDVKTVRSHLLKMEGLGLIREKPQTAYRAGGLSHASNYVLLRG